MASVSSQLAYLPLAEVAVLIKKRELSPVELTQATLDRISTLDSQIHAYYTVFADKVLTEAREAEAQIRAGNYRGPLHGIPVAVKDIYESGPTTGGSKLRKDYVAQQDCTVVAKLKQAGGLLLGKLATYAFCCGIVGMKATYGRVSRAGVFPLSWNLDHTGPMTRTVQDCALMLQACAGYDPLDPACANVPVPDFSAKLERGLKGMRIGIPRKLFAQNCGKEILAAFEAAVAQMGTLGAQIVDVDSITLGELQATFWPLTCADAAAYHLQDLQKRPGDYNPDLRLLLAMGVLVSATAYMQAQRVREQIRRQMLQQLETVDLFMVPTTGVMPAPIRSQSPGLYLMKEDFSIYTPLFNLTGFPALALPCGFSAAGLPIGFQLAGKPFDEATVFQVGYAYEQSTPWHKRHPGL